MAKSRRVPCRRKRAVRAPRKPGYAELTMYGAQNLPKGRHGLPLWLPINDFLDQLRDILMEKGEQVGKQIVSRTHDVIHALKRRGFFLVNYRKKRMRITAKGMEFIADILADISESGQTFTSDLHRFRATCERFKRALQPLARKTKAELINDYERLLAQQRTLDGFNSDYESDGTDVNADSTMADIDRFDDDVIEEDPITPITPGPGPTLILRGPTTPASNQFLRNAVNTPPRPLAVFNRSLVTPLRKALSMGDPRMAYPSPISPPRPLVAQRTVFFTPPASPTVDNHSHSHMEITGDEESEHMDVDDGAAGHQDLDDEEPDDENQQTIVHLTTQVRALMRALENSNQARDTLQKNLDELTRQSMASEALRKILLGKLEDCQKSAQEEIDKDNRIKELEEALEEHALKKQERVAECQGLKDLLAVRSREVEGYQARIAHFTQSMAPLMAHLAGPQLQ